MGALQGTINSQKKEFEEKEEQMRQNIEALQLVAKKSQHEKVEIEAQLKIAQESLVATQNQATESQSPKGTSESEVAALQVKHSQHFTAFHSDQ